MQNPPSSMQQTIRVTSPRSPLLETELNIDEEYGVRQTLLHLVRKAIKGKSSFSNKLKLRMLCENANCHIYCLTEEAKTSSVKELSTFRASPPLTFTNIHDT
jgi:hypothetical protein